VVEENFGEFDELNVIRQYFTQTNLSPFFVKLSTSGQKVCTYVSRNLRCELGCEDINLLKYLHPIAEAEILQANYLYIRNNLEGHFLWKMCTLLSITWAFKL